MPILPVHERLAELWVIRSRRPLTEAEEKDLEHCLALNASYCRQLAHLKNLSLLAAMTNDTEWQHEICRQIEKMTR
ncbi:Putative uncharacterized protein [Thermobacillus xylanilyticus]|jgi:hypothetical protein|uniref:Uncharacterized protein n=3 Tax=Paenibacillaceae TaxID=186822 RepID=L0EBP9_THECK|nr:hypothetical protein Theco_1555 [Thermobacillus composti KWC4]CAG5085088.1 Putative uncharacterized protein [Thermobacillus xylanilyticus]